MSFQILHAHVNQSLSVSLFLAANLGNKSTRFRSCFNLLSKDSSSSSARSHPRSMMLPYRPDVFVRSIVRLPFLSSCSSTYGRQNKLILSAVEPSPSNIPLCRMGVDRNICSRLYVSCDQDWEFISLFFTLLARKTTSTVASGVCGSGRRRDLLNTMGISSVADRKSFQRERF